MLPCGSKYKSASYLFSFVVAVASVMAKSSHYEKPSPIILMKACKNPVEIEGMKASHLRDGAAVVEFLSSLEKSLNQGKAITEYDIDQQLTATRASFNYFLEPSFATIAGVNENGAVIHYRASKHECKTLTKNDMLLLDSGGQYLDGTTDVTRTMHFGKPTDRQV
jgi:Xaa-Pro aminopeptidase